MRLQFLKSKEKRNLLKELEEKYGITELPYLLLETGKQKIRGFSGHLSKEEIVQLTRLTNVEIIGAYLVSQKDEDARVSFDAIQLFKKQITKSIIEINYHQLQLWLRGYDLEIGAHADERSESANDKTPAEKIGVQLAPKNNLIRGVVVLKYQDDLVGIGKSNTEKIFNYVPKERKLKIPLPAEK